MNSVEITPLSSSERIVSLDILRGFAVLGILVMNIQSFSMIGTAYINPTAYGDLTGANKWVWILSHTFADLKFMTIFSILFGAGILLFTDRLHKKGIQKLALHYRRMFWLFVFGLMHAFLLWYGDILTAYALCGAVVILFRKQKPQVLFWLGLGAIAVPSVLYLIFGVMIPFIPAEGMEGIRISWQSTPTLIERELAAYRGGWITQLDQRIPSAIFFQTWLFLMMNGWRAGGLMLIGMALLKWQILSGGKSRTYYVRLILFGFLIGFPLIIFGIIRNFAAGWSTEYSMFLGSQFNYWGSLTIAGGYVGGILLFSKYAAGTWLGKSLSAVGRMAFSNYILQTIICTFIFYGHGLGFFGSADRLTQILIVIAIWIMQLIVSTIWLRYFMYGPLEWLWRSLTYLQLQPVKKSHINKIILS